MGLLGAFTDRIKDSIPPEQRTGAEDIAMGAAHVAVGAEATVAITPDIAKLAEGAAAGLKGAGVTAATEMASNAALGNGGKTNELQIG
jgi:hypothetical protein